MNPRTNPERRAIVAAVAALCLLLAPTAGAQNLSVTDTLFTAGLELRGLVDLPGNETLSLLADPDTLGEFSTRSAVLVWTDDDGRRLREYDVTGTATHGLAFDGKWLWCVGPDPETGAPALVQIESDTLFVEEVFPLPGHRPADLCWGEDHVWLVDRDSGKIDKIDLEKGVVRQSYLAPGFSPCGVVHDGRALWVSDFATGRLYRMSKDGRKIRSVVPLESYARRGESVMLFWADDVLWTAPSGAGFALRLRID